MCLTYAEDFKFSITFNPHNNPVLKVLSFHFRNEKTWKRKVKKLDPGLIASGRI